MPLQSELTGYQKIILFCLYLLRNVVIIAWIAIVIVATGYYVLTTNDDLASQVAEKTNWRGVRHLPKPEVLLKTVQNNFKEVPKVFEIVKRMIPEIIKGSKKLRRKSPRSIQENKRVTLYFKNGSAISGEVISNINGNYVIYWKGGEVAFSAAEIDHVDEGKTISEEIQLAFTEEKDFLHWEYKNDLVIHLTNGEVLDAAIVEVSTDVVTVQYAVEGGGTIEQELKRSRIEYLMHRPIKNKVSRKIEYNLRKQFTKMKYYEDGHFTIVTDSYDTWVREYKRILRENFTDIYLNFFPLFKNRKLQVQNYVIIFDSFPDYFEYALTDGIPGWAAVGYFLPGSKTLFVFNALGDQLSDMIKDAIVGQASRAITSAADSAKRQYGSRYDAFIEGQARSFKEKFWRTHDLIRSEIRQMMVATLKHEAAHEILHNWGIQTIITSKIAAGNEDIIEKKKAFIQTDNIEKKRKLIQEIMVLRKQEDVPDMSADNSWFVEGLAAYCETSPIGEENPTWLYMYQEMIRRQPPYPLEQLTVYQMGSFPGVAPTAQIFAYGQSWAFVHFLMHHYSNGFIKYLERMSQEEAKDHEDLDWLLEAVGKDLRTLEKEFFDYMKTFPEMQDPDIKRFELIRDVFNTV